MNMIYIPIAILALGLAFFGLYRSLMQFYTPVLVEVRYRINNDVLEYSICGNFWSPVIIYRFDDKPRCEYISDPDEIKHFMSTHRYSKEFFDHQQLQLKIYKEEVNKYININA